MNNCEILLPVDLPTYDTADVCHLCILPNVHVKLAVVFSEFAQLAQYLGHLDTAVTA